MSTIAETPRVRARRAPAAAATAPRTRAQAQTQKPRARAGTKASPRARSRAPFAGGVLWIVVVGAMLAGIVAINVVVLQLNVQLDQFGRERAELKADNAMLRSQLSSASTQVRIQDVAKTKLGLEAADQETLTYVRLGAR